MRLIRAGKSEGRRVNPEGSDDNFRLESQGAREICPAYRAISSSRFPPSAKKCISHIGILNRFALGLSMRRLSELRETGFIRRRISRRARVKTFRAVLYAGCKRDGRDRKPIIRQSL